MILGVALFKASGATEQTTSPGSSSRSCSRRSALIASMVGVLIVRPDRQMTGPDGRAQQRLLRHRRRSRPSGIVGVCYWMLPYGNGSSSPLCGLRRHRRPSLAFVFITQYYTAGNYRPVQEIAEASRHGSGDQHHLRHLGRLRDHRHAGARDRRRPARFVLHRQVGRFRDRSASVVSGGIFGTAVATMGMLMTAAYILAMDYFGPITDNAGGIVEMSNAAEACAT